MKNHLLILSALLPLLAACETNRQDAEAIKAQAHEDAMIVRSNAERHGERVANNVRDQIKETSMKLREWWLTPPPEPLPVIIPTSYCYQFLQDIVCYRAPMQGMEHRLVGYQGDMAEPPGEAQTTALPKARLHKYAGEKGMKERVKNAKPIFVSIPVVAKEDKNSAMIQGEAQLGSEPLPDPNLSPQL